MAIKWVEPEEVLKRWIEEDKPEADDELLLTLIEDSEIIILQKFPNIEKRINDGSLDIRLLNMVVSSMIQRAYYISLNGPNQYSFSSGPFSQSESISDKSRRGLYLSEDDIEKISPISMRGKASFTRLRKVRKHYCNPQIQSAYCDEVCYGN